MSNIQLANNLRHLRKQHELTQKDLSRMLNISRQAYSNYETSKRTPDLDSLLYLSRFYHISLDTLVLRNPADTSPLPVFTESLASAGQYFMRIRLMPDVKYDFITRKVKDAMYCKRKLDHTQIRSEMTAV